MIEELDDYQVDEETILLSTLLYRSFFLPFRSFHSGLLRFSKFLVATTVVFSYHLVECIRVCVRVSSSSSLRPYFCVPGFGQRFPVAPMGISAGS